MITSFLTKFFFLTAGIYLLSFGIYHYQSITIRQTEENNSGATVMTLISDDPEDPRQYVSPSIFLQRISPEIEEDYYRDDDIIDYDEKEEKEEIEEKEDTIVEDHEKIISDLKKELDKTRVALVHAKASKENIIDQAKKLRDNVKKTRARFQEKNVTLSYVSDIFAQINPFRKLDLYPTMEDEFYNHKPNASFIPDSIYYGIKRNPGYCDAVDLYNLRNPDNLFKSMNFIADYGGNESLAREEVMRKIGNDVMFDVNMTDKNHSDPRFDLAVNGTMYFFKRASLHMYYQMNREWACLSQMYNHIPGNGVLTRKDLLVETINNYTQRYVNKPKCIPEDQFFPTAFQLDLKPECDRFFQIIKTPEFHLNKEKEPIQYLIKQGYGAHRASGIFLMDDEFEAEIRDTYQDGELCGVVTKPYVAQKYISNPLLLDKKNKFDFRIYMLVASVDPLIVYYHDGFLRVSLSEYDKFSKEKNVHFTNTHLSKEIFQKAQEEDTYNGMTEEQLRDYQMWTMEELESYLLQTGKIHDENWLNNYLRPKFKEAFVHVARMAENSFYKSPSVFEMYGLDFVIDEDLDIWLIEVNASPQLVGTSEKKSSFLAQMLTDLFELEYSYLRSRMKRVHAFVNEMEIKAIRGEPVDYVKMRQDFDKINTNKLEPEFEVDSKNSFVKILDKNLEGSSAYFGHIDDQCV